MSKVNPNVEAKEFQVVIPPPTVSEIKDDPVNKTIGFSAVFHAPRIVLAPAKQAQVPINTQKYRAQGKEQQQ